MENYKLPPLSQSSRSVEGKMRRILALRRLFERLLLLLMVSFLVRNMMGMC